MQEKCPEAKEQKSVTPILTNYTSFKRAREFWYCLEIKELPCFLIIMVNRYLLTMLSSTGGEDT